MNTIYIRTLKRAEHTVFCVQDGQKTYYDPQFNRRIPYSSGQQVKRSLLDSFNTLMNTPGSPTTFYWDVTKDDKLKEGEVFATCDPSYADQLFGGWMKAAKGGKEKTLKRRSPLSISAMRGLHPLLVGTYNEDLTFDRSDRANTEIVVRDKNGNSLDDEAIQEILSGKDRSLRRKWIPDNRRATGLFVQDMAIDLRRLFSININPFEPEIGDETEKKLTKAGWIKTENIFGPCLTAPVAVRKLWMEALASAIINWRISSNQARTFSLMETLAIAISEDANKLAGSIRAKLTENEKAQPIIEETMQGVETFVTLSASAHLITKTESAEALEDAKEYLLGKMEAFDFENQLTTV